MSMFDDKAYKEGVNAGKRIAMGSFIASLAVLAILGVTVAMNSKKHHNNNNNTNPYVKSSEEAAVERPESGNRRTSDELSFWNMYDEEEKEEIVVSENKPAKEPVSKNTAKKKISANTAKKNEAVSENKFNISQTGEAPEYVAINPTLPKAELIEDNFSVVSGNRLVYSQGGRNVSHFGIDVSKYNGTISWNRVKKQGVEFALIRIGARGYSSGSIVLDENYVQNLRGCRENGIDIGAYFFSQAINTTEAMEEANYCVAALSGNAIRYPVIFDSEKILNDSYRTENLSSAELTEIFKAFAQVVKAYGYTPMFAGTKEQLAKHVLLEEMREYDIWLLDPGEKTEYPYRYSIRQYTDRGTLDGISGNVDFNICLISYAEK
ncbi:MAG: glycoside hydrolase family 25 protein [Lachnospiraceae bacterium]|nr:glycoside hydrolase family 25 protein [Lachnospiraceae bacterium]